MQGEQPSSANTRPPPAAIILYHPHAALLASLLETLVADGHRLLLFANGPIGEASDKLLAALEDARIIRSPENLGQGFALNRLVEAAREEGASHILLLDQDSTLRRGVVKELSKALAEHQSKGRKPAVIGPRLVPPQGENYRPLRYAWRNEAEGTAFFTPTSGSLVSLAAFNEIGPFRADFFIDGIDVEWGLRALSRGYDSIVALNLPVEHRWGTPTQPGEGNKPQILRYSKLRCLYYLRNNTAMLRLRHIGLTWKLKTALNLGAQICFLVVARRFDRDTVKLVGRALSDGWHGRLGPAPAELR